MFRKVSRSFKWLIEKESDKFTFLSNREQDNERRIPVPNLSMYRLISKFSSIKTLRCHGKVNVVELVKYLELIKDNLVELDITEANIDLTKLFKQKISVKPSVPI